MLSMFFVCIVVGFCGKLPQNENKEKIIIFFEKCENIFYTLYRIGHHRPIIIIMKNEDANTTKYFYDVVKTILSKAACYLLRVFFPFFYFSSCFQFLQQQML